MPTTLITFVDLRTQRSESFICVGCHRRRRVPGFETGVHRAIIEQACT